MSAKPPSPFFSGLCIGGPKDGQVEKSITPEFKANHFDNTGLFVKTTYKYELLQVPKGDGTVLNLNFFRHSSIASNAEILGILFTFYLQEKRREKVQTDNNSTGGPDNGPDN